MIKIPEPNKVRAFYSFLYFPRFWTPRKQRITRQTAGAYLMNKFKQWIDANIDKKQLMTILAAGVVVGTAAYGLKQAGFSKAATVVKGG